jgi:hypothetical protein
LRGGAEPDYGDDEKDRDEYADSFALHHFTARPVGASYL